MLKHNNFEGQSSGTTLTQGALGNTGSGSGDYFDVIQIGTNAGLTFDNTHAAHRTNAMKVATGGTAALVFSEWTSQLGGSPGTLYFRIYLYMTANPAAARAIARFLTSGAVQCSRLVISTTGKVQFNDAANTAQATTTTSIALNQWVRIEGFCIGSATAGQVEVKLFNTADSTTPTETKTSGSSLNTTGGMAQAQFGITGQTVASATHWMDDIAVTDAGYLGPYVTGTGSIAMFKMSLSGISNEKIRGTGSIAMFKASLSGTGRVPVPGTGSVALPKMGLTGTSIEKILGTGSVGLPKMGLAGTSNEKIPGSGSIELAKPTLTGQGTAPVPGSGSVDLPKMSLTGIGNRAIHGDGSIAMNKMTVFGEFHFRPASELFIFTAV